jgi:hypothetical protein
MKVFEVTAAGFSGETDATDDRVLWIVAADKAQVAAAIEGLGAILCDEVNEKPADIQDAIDFTLPADLDALRVKLKGFQSKFVPGTDSAITLAILEAALTNGLELDFRTHGGSFRTAYLSAPKSLGSLEQHSLLKLAQQLIEAAGTKGAKLTRYDNPPYFNKHTGKTEAGHPRHGDPLLEIDSVWWVKEVADAFKTKELEVTAARIKALHPNVDI